MKKCLMASCFLFLSCILVLAQETKPKVIKYEAPIYPPVARATRTTGEVIVAVRIDNYGRVISAKAENGHIFLKATSETAVQKWIFDTSKQTTTELKVTFIYSIKVNKNPKNNYKNSTYKTKFKKPYALEIVATEYPRIDY